tara:strand:+ start:362 stop:1144 length:783 start_codon:yes stop_codon:yes gene_type:complete
MKDLINKIKSKKYSSLSDEIIEQEIELVLRKKPKAKDKEIIKDVKARLHKIYGSFQVKKKKKRDTLLEELKENLNSLDLHRKILETNLSTKERIWAYQTLYHRIFKITGTPKSILDVGSGINPISYPFLECNPKYTAIEIDKEDVEFINKYFKIKKIDGKAILKAVNANTVKELPKADVTFLFKVIDPLEVKKGHKFSEALLKNIKSKYIITSFSTKTISNKMMQYPRRGWFEKLLQRIGYKFTIVKTKNEFYYVIQKNI